MKHVLTHHKIGPEDLEILKQQGTIPYYNDLFTNMIDQLLLAIIWNVSINKASHLWYTVLCYEDKDILFFSSIARKSEMDSF